MLGELCHSLRLNFFNAHRGVVMRRPALAENSAEALPEGSAMYIGIEYSDSRDVTIQSEPGEAIPNPNRASGKPAIA